MHTRNACDPHVEPVRFGLGRLGDTSAMRGGRDGAAPSERPSSARRRLTTAWPPPPAGALLESYDGNAARDLFGARALVAARTALSAKASSQLRRRIWPSSDAS